MKRIGVLSDTHGYFDESIYKHFADCDEIWHAGDIGTLEVYDKLAAFKPLRAVYGNIDGADIRRECKAHLRFRCEDVDVWLTHIGGYPGRYAREVKPAIFEQPPRLFVCGHSHILRVQYDRQLDMLCVNPGAIGLYGFHAVRTMVKFDVDGKAFRNMQVIEKARK